MNSGLLLVLNQLLPIILPPLMGGSVAGAAVLYKNLVERLPGPLHIRITSLANQVVAGVEQSMSGASGTAKKTAAEQYINSILAGLHLNVPSLLIDSAIESAVYNLNEFKVVEPVSPALEKAATLAPENKASEQTAK